MLELDVELRFQEFLILLCIIFGCLKRIDSFDVFFFLEFYGLEGFVYLYINGLRYYF